ncbi:hypothetical protein AAG906_001006 [Vitis piasezkii]
MRLSDQRQFIPTVHRASPTSSFHSLDPHGCRTCYRLPTGLPSCPVLPSLRFGTPNQIGSVYIIILFHTAPQRASLAGKSHRPDRKTILGYCCKEGLVD